MKIKFLTIILIIFLLFTGCTTKNADRSLQPEQTPNNQYVKPSYTITEINGKHYLNFSDGNEWNYDDIGNMDYNEVATIDFNTLSDMKYAIENNTFNKDQIRKIKRDFKRDVNGIEIINTNELFMPAIPLELTCEKYCWQGNNYGGLLLSKDDMNCSFRISYDKTYNNVFKSEHEKMISNELITITSIKQQKIRGLSATIYEFYTDISVSREIWYEIAVGNKTLYVIEWYLLVSYDMPCSETVPYQIKLYGNENNCGFYYYLFDLDELPSIDWISSFGIEPYVN